jgi:acetyl-CoA acyltransferase
MSSRTAVIVDAVRSPVGRGKPTGALAALHPVELLGQTISGLLARNDLDPAEVEDVIVGCVSQAGEQAGGVGRLAWLSAGLPEHVPATTIDRKCGSSQQAAHFAAQGVLAGAYDVVVVGGVESMSRVPMGSSLMGRDAHGPGVAARYSPGLIPQGVSAELVAAKWGISRAAMDAYSAQSHHRAAACAEAGDFDNEIVPITVPDVGDGTHVVRDDETVRPSTTADRLAELSPAFTDSEMSVRFPQIEWSVTAGNSSQISDGAAAMLVMSEERAHQCRLTPRARFHAFSVVADDPVMMLTAPIPATTKVLERAGLTVDRIDHFEVNEAFASVPLAWQKEFRVDRNLMNPRGGAIALGHPLGASGLRLMTTMLGALEATGGRYGLQTMCEAGGMANGTIIELI